MSVFRASLLVLFLAGLATAEEAQRPQPSQTWHESQGSFVVLEVAEPFLDEVKSSRRLAGYDVRTSREICVYWGGRYCPQEGDIVLVRARQLCPLRWPRPYQAVTRLATLSRYLHVGIIVRDSQGDLKVLEAVKGQGVQFCQPLSFFQEYLEQGDEVEIRRLKRQLTSEQSRRLTEFAKRHVGQSYATVRELLSSLTAKPVVRDLPTPDKFVPDSDERWYCSELTVVACQEIGLLGAEVRGSGTIPSDLANGEVDLSPWSRPVRWCDHLWWRRLGSNEIDKCLGVKPPNIKPPDIKGPISSRGLDKEPVPLPE